MKTSRNHSGVAFLRRALHCELQDFSAVAVQRTPTTSRTPDDSGASAPEQREQDYDRKGNSEYPQQQAATEAHHVLLG